MPEQSSISQAPLTYPAMDYALLRKEGIAHIQNLAGHIWTDHNVHDPGITILEQLCYAITDLSYRINFDLPDLLSEGGSPTRFHSPGEVMSSAPLTLQDFRKLLIDIKGIRNAWIIPLGNKYEPQIYYDDTDRSLSLQQIGRDTEILAIKGLYRILLAMDTETNTDEQSQALLEAKNRFHAHRPLCTDIGSIEVLQNTPLYIRSKIEVREVDDPEALLARIYYRIQNYISPSLRFHSLSERLESGIPIEEVMEGPLLQHGFIDDDELASYALRKHLRASDLISLIMQEEGVLAVRSIAMSNSAQINSLSWQKWSLSIPDRTAPAWKPFLADAANIPLFPIRLVKEKGVVQVDWNRVKQLYEELRNNSFKHLLTPEQAGRLPVGRDRDVSNYDSIQSHFPDLYGIGPLGLPRDASPQRKSQALQLKAYLSFIDQILANQFAQLGYFKDLFSGEIPVEGFPKTYKSQTLHNSIPNYHQLLLGIRSAETESEKEVAREAFSLHLEDSTENPKIPGDPSLSLERKNRLLNHLMARFAEELTDYSLMLFHDADDEKPKALKLAKDKSAFLKDFLRISSYRGTGFDYTQESWDTENISGLKLRICRLLGIEETKRTFLGTDTVEGFHILEHILLRPGFGDKNQKSPYLVLPPAMNQSHPPLKDPYSLQLSFIFPNWMPRFQDHEFRRFIFKSLREETPAHIRIYVNWMSQTEMQAFEKNHKLWLEEIRNNYQHE